MDKVNKPFVHMEIMSDDGEMIDAHRRYASVHPHVQWKRPDDNSSRVFERSILDTFEKIRLMLREHISKGLIAPCGVELVFAQGLEVHPRTGT